MSKNYYLHQHIISNQSIKLHGKNLLNLKAYENKKDENYADND
jgi:hypothetical protein